MRVIKRSGEEQEVQFDKIIVRLKLLAERAHVALDIGALAQKIIGGLCSGMTTAQIDIYSANVASSMSIDHPEYAKLATYIAVDNLHKCTKERFSEKVAELYWQDARVISPDFYEFVRKNGDVLDSIPDYARDYTYSYFGFKTLENAYLLKVGSHVVERPQDMLLRVATALHMHSAASADAIDRIRATYESLSIGLYTHASPTLFNAGSPRSQLSSCFLIGSEDSGEGIMKTLTDCARISKWGGGIGIHVDWRGAGAFIRGTNGQSSGVIAFLKMFNYGARAFNQGGKRNGSFAIYLEMHHPDIISFLEMRRPHGPEHVQCLDLFTALWVSDLFMERVRDDGPWSTFCPDKRPLHHLHGAEYRAKYLEYEAAGYAVKTYQARHIWEMVYTSQKESGMPYICYKDAVNRSTMHAALGTVRSSNLCAEINLYSDENEYAVCNLASICLSKFVVDDSEPDAPVVEFPKKPRFDFDKLVSIAGEITENLNNVIDISWNPCIETARSNFRHRPIGVGVQGLADVFMMFKYPFDSAEALLLSNQIAEAIHYGCLRQSNIIARRIHEAGGQTAIFTAAALHDYPALRVENEMPTICCAGNALADCELHSKMSGSYPSYISHGSPLRQDTTAPPRFHWELCGSAQLSGMFDWEGLRADIATYGVRNSLTTAYMPTASTSQIMGSSPSFEAYGSNLYQRKTLAGEFIISNKYLVHDLIELGLWTEEIRTILKARQGSVQGIIELPQRMRDVYKTAFEIKQKAVIDLAAGRQPFIDQSQSMNLFKNPFSFKTFDMMQQYAWNSGLKTGCYYMRTKAAAQGQLITIDPNKLREIGAAQYVEPEECEMCSA